MNLLKRFIEWNKKHINDPNPVAAWRRTVDEDGNEDIKFKGFGIMYHKQVIQNKKKLIELEEDEMRLLE